MIRLSSLHILGTSKMAHELRQFSAHPKDPDWIPSTHMVAQKHRLLQFRAVQQALLTSMRHQAHMRSAYVNAGRTLMLIK